ncbi:RNA polymerase ECF family sigma subunit [Nocardia neocaledoniensis]|uniref:RNA polymerase ECF family sigma subunit n=2 Tax=Nocardia neocaledoniensis TaxID=236511 RepID=A0A317NHV8_9NOCA|nr:sigma-70 family RNA polymerase sigma factor [Nocardia neocaledoniensis]PWV74234.1 RNA polymerase ECF family sigma subunit [Nocardia neocaledoniensis]
MRADSLATAFERRRVRLRALALRLLGSTAEADDAVQETWLRLDRAATTAIGDLDGWLTTVLTRICLDALRTRTRRAETTDTVAAGVVASGRGVDPEDEALLADAVGRALVVVLDTLGPEERVAFVLHDLFAVPFADLAPMVGRTPATAKKLASRARARVHAPARLGAVELTAHRRAVAAFLRAAREGDLAGLLAILAPDVVRTADPAALAPGMAALVRGAAEVAEGALALRQRSRDAVELLVDGLPGLVVAVEGRPLFAVTFTVRAGLISAYDVVAAPDRLAELTLALPPRQP